jgi:hypothetical protein
LLATKAQRAQRESRSLKLIFKKDKGFLSALRVLVAVKNLPFVAIKSMNEAE